MISEVTLFKKQKLQQVGDRNMGSWRLSKLPTQFKTVHHPDDYRAVAANCTLTVNAFHLLPNGCATDVFQLVVNT